MKSVTVIPASVHRFTDAPLTEIKKRKVAAYARVSTDEEEQQTSYAAQCDYYEKYIKSREDWEFVGLYSDEGITGTCVKKRLGFLKMVDDALNGKIELIVTKSVSRFARNTIDSLTTIRKLKASGIEIYFEKENIHTFDPKCEMLLTILSSLSQEEARSISENTTWGQRKRFADGKVSVPFSRFLGYDRGEDGNLVINPEQAKIVKLIFKLFLSGLSYTAIAKELTARKIKTPTGKEVWRGGSVQRILSSEKMKGDALLQKSFTEDFLTKKMVKNEGQVPQYYVTGNHEAIIDPATFDLVQAEMERRKNCGRYSGVTIFSNKIKCGECGNFYGSKIWHSTDKYRRVIYQCNHKYDGKKCATPHLTEEEIKAAFIKAVNQMLKGKKAILENIKIAREKICNTKELEKESEKLRAEMQTLSEMAKNSINENARIAQDQTEYKQRYGELLKRYDEIKNKYDAVSDEIKKRRIKSEILTAFAKSIDKENILSDFDEGLWGRLVDFMTVYAKDEIGVTFRDGTEIRV